MTRINRSVPRAAWLPATGGFWRYNRIQEYKGVQEFVPREGGKPEESGMKWIKRLVVALVVIFALFYLFTRPTDAADAVKSAFGAVGNGMSAVMTFFSSLTS